MAFYESWEKQGANLGEPVEGMVKLVKGWLASGEDVRVFTARAAPSNPNLERDTAAIQAWCERHLGKSLPVTNQKDFETSAIYDDLAWHVIPNRGIIAR